MADLVHLARMRPNQERVRHILDVEHGEPTLDPPTVESETDRNRLEHAARSLARSILETEEVRAHIAGLEAAQQAVALAELGLADTGENEPSEPPDGIDRLHHAVTLAHLIQTAPLTPQGDT